jgi:hypothetical protein
MNILNKPPEEQFKEFEARINGSIKKLTYSFEKLKRKKPDLKTLTTREYLWIVFAYNIYLKAEDILDILKIHKDKEKKIIATPYIILRSIVEDYFYLKLLLADNSKIEINFKAYIVSSVNQEKKHLNCILNLAQKGKFILKEGAAHVTSEVGAKAIIEEYEIDNKKLSAPFDQEEFSKLVKVYGSVEEVCKTYDRKFGMVL